MNTLLYYVRIQIGHSLGQTSQKTEAQLNQQAPGCCLQYGQMAALSSYTQRQPTPALLKG